MKKVASADAAFFVPKLLQEREQRQDRLDEVHNEHEPILFVHDITPSLARGSRLTDYHIKYITRSKIFQSKIHKGTDGENSSLERRGLEKIFPV